MCGYGGGVCVCGDVGGGCVMSRGGVGEGGGGVWVRDVYGDWVRIVRVAWGESWYFLEVSGCVVKNDR